LRQQLSASARRLGVALVLVSGVLVLGGCSQADKEQVKRLAEPVGVTNKTDRLHSLWMGSWLAAILVGLVVWGLIIYACIAFRRKRDDEIPVQTRYNLPLEILYTVAPVVMVLVFFYFTVVEQNKALADPKHPDHTVTVVGQQWSWTFNYDKDTALDGSTTVYEAGTPAHEPTLVLPVNKSVRVILRSPDVIHDFWVPAFLMKQDVVPGRNPPNGFSFTPTRKGTYVGRCAELCGTYHSRMLFNVKVVDEADYATYLKSLKTRGNIGPALGGAEASEESGLGRSTQENRDRQ
jgi:cytochrome c oxidase subunit 2